MLAWYINFCYNLPVVCLAGDLVVDVRNRELDILMELLSRLRILEPRLRTAAQRLAELDVLLAFTAAALKYQWVTWFKWENHRSGWWASFFSVFFFERDFWKWNPFRLFSFLFSGLFLYQLTVNLTCAGCSVGVFTQSEQLPSFCLFWSLDIGPLLLCFLIAKWFILKTSADCAKLLQIHTLVMVFC